MTTITWSYSRRSTLEQCARAYYFNYYGANKRTAKQEPNKGTLHSLKQLQNRHERAGSLLHIAISTYFREAHRGNKWIFDTSKFISWARKMFRDDRNYSRAHPDGNEKKKKNFGRSPVLLQEYHYRLENADLLWQEAEEKLINALRSFATDSSLDIVRINGCKPDALVEHRINFTIQNVRVDGQIDLAYPDNDRIVVIDWKSGSATMDGSSSLQLAVYALWATKHFECPPENVQVYMIHLGSNDVSTSEITGAELADVRARILQDAELIENLQSYGKNAVADAFPPLLHKPMCSLCQFQKVCYA